MLKKLYKVKDISIIIPVLNDALWLDRLFETLLYQETVYDYEVIIVDNGSTDDLIPRLTKYPMVKYLSEFDHLHSPYSARNRGIEESSAEILVFLDVTCQPRVDWLQNAVTCMEEQGAHLVSSNVLFDFQNQATASKIIDSVINLKIEESIRIRNVCPTASLFVKRDVIEKIGLFNEGLRSGEDLSWTGRATDDGFKLIFCESSRVYKIPRGFKELIRKQWRVSKGKSKIHVKKRNSGSSLSQFRRIISIDYNSLRSSHVNFQLHESYLLITKILFVAFVLKIVMVTGRFSTLIYR